MPRNDIKWRHKLEDEVDELTKRIRLFVSGAVSKKRYEHSVSTAKMCKKLCEIFGLDKKLGFLSGIAHDMCKNFSPELILSLAKKDGLPFTSLELSKPELLHGRAAAVKLQNDFGVKNKDVIEAVQNHTFGKKNMRDLAKVLFVADKIEPTRENITKDYLKKLLTLPLDKIVLEIVDDNIKYIEKKGRIVAESTRELREWLVGGK